MRLRGGNYIQRLVGGDYYALNDIYETFRSPFIAYSRKSLNLSVDDAADLFQEACVCILQNVRNGKITRLENAQLGAYLMTTGRLLNANRVRKRGIETVEIGRTGEPVADDGDDSAEREEMLKIIRDVVENIPNPCSTLLTLQYFQMKRQAEIAQIMGYESADSVKTMVSRCKGKARVIARQKLRELGYED